GRTEAARQLPRTGERNGSLSAAASPPPVAGTRSRARPPGPVVYDLLPMATAPERTTPVDDLARVVLEDVSPLDVVVSVPGTSYRLALSPAEDTAALRSLTGKRVR